MHDSQLIHKYDNIIIIKSPIRGTRGLYKVYISRIKYFYKSFLTCHLIESKNRAVGNINERKVSMYRLHAASTLPV